MPDTMKILGKKSFRFNKIYKLACDYFSITVISFDLFIRNVFMIIKNPIFPPKYTRYGKNIVKQNCLSQKNLQLWS